MSFSVASSEKLGSNPIFMMLEGAVVEKIECLFDDYRAIHYKCMAMRDDKKIGHAGNPGALGGNFTIVFTRY